MPPAPSSRAARRQRLTRRRRVVAGGASTVIVGALTVGVFGFIGSLDEDPRGARAAPAPTAQSLAASDAQAADAPTFDVTAAADEAMTTLADYSDAARATEDALYEASEVLRATTTAEAADLALTATQQAADAVRADAEAYRASLIAASSATNTQPTGGDVAAQMSYLHEYVFDYNSAQWGDYNPYGGDCTNYASQGLIARGWQPDDTWYSDGEMWTASEAWIGTVQMSEYFDALGLSYSTEADLDRVRVGDIGLFSWGELDTQMDHTMTVSKVEYVPGGPPKVSFISHNEDGEYRDLTTVLHVEHTDSQVWIYHIP